ncbi:MAG: hypothetical protein WAJ85_01860 [Candidatus Baltobacteraceae bacterium]
MLTPRWAIALAITIALAATAPQRVNASYDYHIQYEYDYNYYDTFAYFRAHELTSTYPSDPDSFITFEQWRADYSSSQSFNYWEEVGVMSGNLNNNNWEGGFGAAMQSDGYYEFALGSYNGESTAPSTSLAVNSSNSYLVQYNFDGVAYYTVTTSAPYASSMTVGVESNEENPYFENTFISGMDSSYYQIYAGGSSWLYWPASADYYNDSPSGQYATYGYDSGGHPHGYWYY